MTAMGDIQAFFGGDIFAVVGASNDRDKYGNKVLRAYQQAGKQVYPVNPGAEAVEGLAAYPDLNSLPEKPHGVAIVTPPDVTDAVVEEAIDSDIGHIWMQPGAESEEAVETARAAGVNVIAGGPCALVELGFLG